VWSADIDLDLVDRGERDSNGDVVLAILVAIRLGYRTSGGGGIVSVD